MPTKRDTESALRLASQQALFQIRAGKASEESGFEEFCSESPAALYMLLPCSDCLH